MGEIIMMRGLPASGKTTIAKELVRQGLIRVNKDDLREMLNNGVYSKDKEKLVLEIRDAIIDIALSYGLDVVVDDTNFEQKHIEKAELIASLNEASVKIRHVNTDVDECIRRDSKRDKPVGEEVITNMYNKHISDKKKVG